MLRKPGRRALLLRQHAADLRADDVLTMRQHRLRLDVRHRGEHPRLAQRAARARTPVRAACPQAPMSVACAVTLRMRVRSSRSKPFMTDSTTISTATPSTSPEDRHQRDEGDEIRAGAPSAGSACRSAIHMRRHERSLVAQRLGRRGARGAQRRIHASQQRQDQAPRRRSTRRSASCRSEGMVVV